MPNILANFRYTIILLSVFSNRRQIRSYRLKHGNIYSQNCWLGRSANLWFEQHQGTENAPGKLLSHFSNNLWKILKCYKTSKKSTVLDWTQWIESKNFTVSLENPKQSTIFKYGLISSCIIYISRLVYHILEARYLEH